MSTPPSPSLTDLDRRIRRAGKIGRILCTLLLIGGTLFTLWLLATIATQPEAIVRMNLTPERAAKIANYKLNPSHLVTALQSKPDEVETLARAQVEANKCQDLVDHPEKRGGSLALITLLAVLILGFIWLVRQLFAAFAEGEVINAGNARTLKRIGVIGIVCGILSLNLGLVISGLLVLILGWTLEQALALKAEQDLVI